jgi:hypothetical protein
MYDLIYPILRDESTSMFLASMLWDNGLRFASSFAEDIFDKIAKNMTVLETPLNNYLVISSRYFSELKREITN